MTAQTDATTAAAQAAGENAHTDPDFGYFPRTVIVHADGTESHLFAPEQGAAVEAGFARGWLLDRFDGSRHDDAEMAAPTSWLDPVTTPEEAVALAVAEATQA